MLGSDGFKLEVAVLTGKVRPVKGIAPFGCTKTRPVIECEVNPPKVIRNHKVYPQAEPTLWRQIWLDFKLRCSESV
jgi:hypothetical protein